MKLNLSDDEFAQLTKYKTQLQGVASQVDAIQAEADKRIALLIAQGDEVKDMLETCWLAAYRRGKLEDPELVDEVIPAMVNERGEQIVTLKAKDKTAHWESVHDQKRVASDEAVQNSDEENSDE